MAPRACPTCNGDLEAETIGRRPGRLVGWCPACELVVEPHLTLVPDHSSVVAFRPLSSQDRREFEDDLGPGAA